MKPLLKQFANVVAITLMLPLALPCWAEQVLLPHREDMHMLWAQVLALLPGMPGVYLRRGFYRLVLRRAADDFTVAFGTLIVHRETTIESGVYIGCYALIGQARLRENCLIGSRTSLTSGSRQHEMGADGKWTPTSMDSLQQIEVGPNAWIGEGAIVMADVGAGAVVSAGAVISSPVPAAVMMAGNPARFVRRLPWAEAAETTATLPSTGEIITPAPAVVETAGTSS